MAQYERVIIDLVESATRTIKTAPLVLGGNGGAGGGVGTPPGGIVGQLPQYRVSYDSTEAATLATNPSGVAGISGWSLVDNLNHIRYRLGQLEAGSGVVAGSGVTVIDENTSSTYTDVDTIHFVGSGVVVTDLGSGDVRVRVDATSSGGSQSKFAILSSNYDDVTITNTNNSILVLDTEVYNDDGLVSLNSNVATVLEDGWYDVQVTVAVSVNGGSALGADGYFYIYISNNGFFDNAYSYNPTVNGSTISYSDAYARCSVYLSADDGNEIYVRVDNNTGYSMTAYVHEVLIRPLK